MWMSKVFYVAALLLFCGHGRSTNPEEVYVVKGTALPYILFLVILWFC